MYEPVIGLEIHIQLKTKTKMFCGCKTHDNTVSPNTNVCPICLGHPGTLPVPNEEAIRAGVLVGLALNCQIASHSKFDRKNYFYPDLPKAYQISQFDLPIAEKGFLEIEVPRGEREKVKIEITRAHLEEDAAKNIHDESGKTFVDFNRGGTPLIEIVTEPDFRTAREAKIFLQELRLIARYLGVSDADMEKGHLRCDANVSLRPIDNNNSVVGELLNPKTETKNLNSFKHVERAIEYEIMRQTKLWEAGTPPTICTTRGWNDSKGITEDQRSKEEAADYRYFPDPDIPQMDLSEIADEMKRKLPELPAKKRARFEEEYALKPSDARQICDDVYLADFTEHVFSELHAWLNAMPEYDGLSGEARSGLQAGEAEKKKLGKLTAGWLLSKLMGIMSERSIDMATISGLKAGSGSAGKITPENFAEFITLVATKKITNSTGLQILNAMLDDGSDPSHIMEDKQLGQIEDAGVLAEIVDNVIDSHPVEVERYKAGDEKLMAFFIGMVMKESQGTADPGISKNMLKVKLNA